ncbi:unnamed protein product [Meganyctiphanes norvegica]|uniref:Secreted protein n=1 Tax=Meganyctiphanes norvegica TaxID=48144 RepID=A0AAV2QQR1_MEGNR
MVAMICMVALVEWIEEAWTEVAWTEVAWIEVAWTEVAWTEVEWTEVEWTEVAWTEVAWIEVVWIDFNHVDVHHHHAALPEDTPVHLVTCPPDAFRCEVEAVSDMQTPLLGPWWLNRISDTNTMIY